MNCCHVVMQPGNLLVFPRDVAIFFLDEAHFHLSMCANKEDMHYWNVTNPRELHQWTLHSDRVTVWTALSRSWIIGPYFFEEDIRAVSVNSIRYITMILPELDVFELKDVWSWRMRPEPKKQRLPWTWARFPGHLISLWGDFNWPTSSPDLAPCDFFCGDTSNAKFTITALRSWKPSRILSGPISQKYL